MVVLACWTNDKEKCWKSPSNELPTSQTLIHLERVIPMRKSSSKVSQLIQSFEYMHVQDLAVFELSLYSYAARVTAIRLDEGTKFRLK